VIGARRLTRAGAEARLRWVLALLLLAGGGVAVASASSFGQSFVAEIAIFALFAMSTDFVAGGVGLMSVGQGLYFGLGAYTTAWLATGPGWPALGSVPIAMALAALAAAAVGAVIVRFGEIIFILLTLSLGEMVYAFIFADRDIGGSDGIAGVPRADLSALGLDFDDPRSFTLVALALAFATFVLLDGVLRSPFGLVMAAIRQNPLRARAQGADLTAVRTAVYSAGAALAALAGSLLAQLNQFVSPDLTGWMISGQVLIMAILGGLGSLSGAALGAVVIELASHYLARLTDKWGLIVGLVFIATVLFAENGLFALLRRVSRPSKGPAAEVPPARL
jgi:branched-chain amino acid transport system permease protein